MTSKEPMKKFYFLIHEWKFKSLLNKHVSLFCLYISFANRKCERQLLSWFCSPKKVKMSRGLINRSNPLTACFCVSITLHPSYWSRGESFLIKFVWPFGITSSYFLSLRFKTKHVYIIAAIFAIVFYITF